MLRSAQPVLLHPLAILIDPDKIEVLGRRLAPIPLEELAAARSRRGPHEAPPPPMRQFMALLGERAAPDEVRNTPRPLLPRLVKDGTWAFPTLVLVRPAAPSTSEPGYRRLSWALEEMASDLGDPSLPHEAMRAFTEAVLGDEFTGRVAGDTARSGHAARTLPGMLPWLVACLPDEFSLTDLHRAVIACLSGGLSATATGAAESPSNFRRRVNDLVLTGVLEEVPGSGRSDAERPGRPPRMFRFSTTAWATWLRRRAGDGQTPAPPDDWRLAALRVIGDPAAESPSRMHHLTLHRAAEAMLANATMKPSGPEPESQLWRELRALLDRHGKARRDGL